LECGGSTPLSFVSLPCFFLFPRSEGAELKTKEMRIRATALQGGNDYLICMPTNLIQYECGPLRFDGDDCYDRHLVFDHATTLEQACSREHFEALSRSLRDVLMQRWLKTQATYDKANPKRVYYLSLEFLIGRTLGNNILNLGVEEFVVRDLASGHQHWRDLQELEPDAGLGNGGLGRLAACFVDSMATLAIPAIGYGLQYEFGIFQQEIQSGRQVERPDPWLRHPDPWEVARPTEAVDVTLNAGIQVRDGAPRLVPQQTTRLQGVPHDRPVVGYGGKTINTLRLWEAVSPNAFDLGEFNHGDFFGAVHNRVMAENLTRVLYPDDSTSAGRGLRFGQEFFLVACSLADIIRRFRAAGNDWLVLPDKVAIQLNDTHPSLAVAELMRILVDDAKLPWDVAWDLTVRTLAYTNHTLLPEALEKWPVRLFELALPRHLEIIYEINRRFLDLVNVRFPDDHGRLARMSLIEEGASKQVRMAHLAIVGTHSTNGVAAIHSELLRTRTVKDFADIYPERFSNKTNGVTPRRWIALANPELAHLITEAIGPAWITNLSELRKLAPLANETGFRGMFARAKREAKAKFAAWAKQTTGHTIDPDSLFDCQIKRIHEYKRQLLNLLHIVIHYNRLRSGQIPNAPPRTFFFAGKAAPAYVLAKVVINLINNVADVIDADPAVRGRLKVMFLPDYNVTLAQRLIPAADVSEQISTAGYEASGTSNMKFMMNGALTVGTRDGATIEMAQEAGEENFFLFGLTAEQVIETKGWYNPRWHYDQNPEIRAALDMIAGNVFSRDEPELFRIIWDTLITNGDHYLHLADLDAYTATQTQVSLLFADRDAWMKKAILNVAHSGQFSSDRTIAEYARDIWRAKPCPVS
jgi:starch phosphorylase